MHMVVRHDRTASLVTSPAAHADTSTAGNVVKSLERKVEEEAGRAAPRPATQADGRTSKPDTTVGVELGWLRDVRPCLGSWSIPAQHPLRHRAIRPLPCCGIIRGSCNGLVLRTPQLSFGHIWRALVAEAEHAVVANRRLYPPALAAPVAAPDYR